ncbi:hypothetical protein EIP91_003097 [Steccherinum ochraceum]|uniref:DUF6593 domain-containing protein n=1 Tax=Steccherinum ochraceum TaxID=92696 RepID=A0A4R0RML8_9APHY|nr:hypothetical protein EIP91_003097 [Steccherinum ochraceum]
MAGNMNPFLAGGWCQPGDEESQPGENESGSPPSIFGALPSLSSSKSLLWSAQPDNATFSFTSFNSTILNCTVLSPQKHVAYRIVTEPSAPSYTILKDNDSRNVAMVQWQPNSTLEIRGAAPSQRIKDWLSLSSDKRKMWVRGVPYSWTTVDGFICLYKSSSSAPRILARIARARSVVLLECTQEALLTSLLEPCLVATILFVCGHNID